METEYKLSQHPVAGVSELTPTFYSLFVLNLPLPTHSSLYLQPLEIIFLLLLPFSPSPVIYLLFLFVTLPLLFLCFGGFPFTPPLFSFLVSTILFLLSGMYYWHKNILCRIK